MTKTASKSFYLFCLALFCVDSLQVGAGELTRYLIHSQQPPKEWFDCFPIGNGLLGAMVLGYPVRDRIALNHDWLWRGSAGRQEIKVAQMMPEFRRLFLSGRFEDAGRLMKNEIMYTGGDMYSHDCDGHGHRP